MQKIVLEHSVFWPSPT